MCTCGETIAHPVARRETADGTTVVLWSDGPVTLRLGHAIPGVPIARPRSQDALVSALRAGRLFLGELVIHESTDLAALYDACRWVARRGGSPGDVRARLAHMQRPVLTPVWQVLSADRDGRPTERVWRLPRMRWPGLAVWDNVNHGRGGRYEIHSAISADRTTYETTGIRFRTLAEVSEHLARVAE